MNLSKMTLSSLDQSKCGLPIPNLAQLQHFYKSFLRRVYEDFSKIYDKVLTRLGPQEQSASFESVGAKRRLQFAGSAVRIGNAHAYE